MAWLMLDLTVRPGPGTNRAWPGQSATPGARARHETSRKWRIPMNENRKDQQQGQQQPQRKPNEKQPGQQERMPQRQQDEQGGQQRQGENLDRDRDER